jgi:hypothetical protein
LTALSKQSVHPMNVAGEPKCLSTQVVIIDDRGE